MNFRANEGMATKISNFILSIVLVATIVIAVCVMVKSASDKNKEQPACMQINPSQVR